MTKFIGYYQICVRGSTEVVTIATVTKEETTSSGSSSSSAEGYYKVVSGNTTTIYRVVTYYSWVNIVEDQHPNVSAQKVAGTWGYDMFRLTNFMFDYEEKDISSMNTGYIYGVIEDA